MTTWYFVAGEQVITRRSSNVLDAWLGLENFSRRHPVASEFRRLPIAAHDEYGKVVDTKTWQQWHEAVLRDTYGDAWREHLEHAIELSR